MILLTKRLQASSKLDFILFFIFYKLLKAFPKSICREFISEVGYFLFVSILMLKLINVQFSFMF